MQTTTGMRAFRLVQLHVPVRCLSTTSKNCLGICHLCVLQWVMAQVARVHLRHRERPMWGIRSISLSFMKRDSVYQQRT
ncbi:hypothetical protein L210DRAFT_57362 [Boletus edulis BED1]|uniref:Uncharacterized protein n=1 Tax=Boletus edulis BED1 TaxID=1328754 RepID=A0AAD4BT45_BOLED|nr:hypothetical protein L210DRAFT_57362 [Boletus edulis BED1]